MKHILLFVLLISCGKTAVTKQTALPKSFVADQLSDASSVSTEAEASYKNILRTQEEALNSMSETNGGFQLNEMITDIAVAKSGILGLSALKANSGVELSWKRKAPVVETPHEKSDFVIDENTSVMDATQAIADLAGATGKITITPKVRTQIATSLSQIRKIVDETGSSALGHWQFKGIRFDLNFAINGQVYFFAKAGTNLRLRMEWNYTKKSAKGMSQSSRFIINTLSALNKVNDELALPGFTAKQIALGVGTTFKGQIGIWKYSPGFLGWLMFVPKTSKEFSAPGLSGGEDFLLGGFEEKSGTQSVPHSKIVEGLRKSLKTAAFFADAGSSTQGRWQVSVIKTINDISYTGLFGLADFTTRGVMEIDFRRNNL